MVLDTDTISYYLRGSESIKEMFIEHKEILASTTVNYAELVYGLKKRDNKKYLPQVELMFKNIRVYEFCKKSAALFGTLKADMQKRGEVVADMDLMIGSIALANEKELISNNLAHFSKIDGLNVKSWI